MAADFDSAVVFVANHANAAESAWLDNALHDIPGTEAVPLEPSRTRGQNQGAFDLAAHLNRLLDAGHDVEDAEIADMADRLEALQKPDGSWPDANGQADVRTSVLALRALIRMERFGSHPFFN